MRQLLALSLLTSIAYSAEPALNDLRFSVAGSLDYSQEVEFSSLGIPASETDADVLAFSLAYVRGISLLSPTGTFFYGGQAEYNHLESESVRIDSSEASFTTTLIGVGVQAGYAYALPAEPKLHGEIALSASYYIGSQDRLISTTSTAVGVDGFGYNIRMGGYYLFDNGIQLGLELTYVLLRDFDVTATESISDVSESHNGLLIGLSIGTRL